MKNVYLLKYNEELHYEWSSQVIEETDDQQFPFDGSFERRLLELSQSKTSHFR